MKNKRKNNDNIINDNNEKRNEILITEQDEEDFLPLNTEDIPRYSYSFTSSLYNNRINYNQHDAFKRKYIGQFILSEKLGQGTFGIVVLATHQITGEKVAVKILEKEKILQESDKTRIEREIKILKNMRHNNIVHLYDIKETPSSLYIIMEYISGKELFEYIVSKKRLSELESCNFYQQLISGIEYLGKIRVVHRDLKPENLLLDEQKKIKIVDFGLSNIYPNNELLKTACGSPCYAAPEMINGEPYMGLRVDIWSSGIVLFAMLCGYLPFEDSDNEKLYKKITQGKFKTPNYLSDYCKDFLHRVLNINPDKRYNIEQIKNHPWFNIINPKINMSEGLLLHTYIVPIDESIINEMVYKLKFNEEEVRANLIANNHNHTTTTYYLLLKKKIREGKKSIGDMKSKEFLNYLKNPINLLSTYGYNFELIIQLRIRKVRDILELNNFDNNGSIKSLSIRTQSGTNMNHKQLSKNQSSDDQFTLEKKNSNKNDAIKIKTIYNKKENELLKRLKYKNKKTKMNTNKKYLDITENIDINNKFNKKNKGKNGIKNKNKNDSTKESLNYNNNSNSNNLINNDNNKKNSSIITKKIKQYEISFFKKYKQENYNHQYSISCVNQIPNEKEENKITIDNKKDKDKDKDKDRDYSYEFHIKNNNNDINNSNKQKYKKNMFQIKPKRTITNAFVQRNNNIENKNNFKTITERGFNDSISEKKNIKKKFEKHFTIKAKKNNKNPKPLKENTEFMINKYNLTNINNNKIKEKDGQLKIDELMGRMKMRVKKNVTEKPKKTKEVSYDNFSKDKNYYLLTDKEKDKVNKTNTITNTTNELENRINFNINEYKNKKKDTEKVKEKRNVFSSNNSSKMVQNLLKIDSFRLKEDKDNDNNNEIRIKKAVKNDNERKTREQKIINRRFFSRKGFIDTSVSFDKSHDGRLRDSTRPRKIFNIQTERKKFNLIIKNKTNNNNTNTNNNLMTNDKKEIEENSSNSSNLDNDNKNKENKVNIDEIKRKQKDNKYLKLKSKNKKFDIVKIDEDNKVNNINENLNIEKEKQMFKQKNHNKSKQNEKLILKRNKFENANYSVKNYTNVNYKINLNTNNYNTINHEDLSNNKTEREKNKKAQKIKTLNTQGNFIKKLTIRKKHFHNSLNESKKDMYIKRTINSNLNEKFKSFNNCDNYNSIDDIFYQTCINNNHKQVFPFHYKEKNTIEEINNNKENKNKDEEYMPFELNGIFIDKLNNIKNILLKEIKLKKWKYKIKKNGYLIYKDENQFDIDINKYNNNIYIIKTLKRQGKYKIYNNIIRNITSKLK